MKDEKEIEVDLTDLLLVGAIVVLSIITLFLLLPMIWSGGLGVLAWCVRMIDVRNWSRWTWFALNAVAVGVLLLIRFRRRKDG